MPRSQSVTIPPPVSLRSAEDHGPDAASIPGQSVNERYEVGGGPSPVQRRRNSRPPLCKSRPASLHPPHPSLPSPAEDACERFTRLGSVLGLNIATGVLHQLPLKRVGHELPGPSRSEPLGNAVLPIQRIIGDLEVGTGPAFTVETALRNPVVVMVAAPRDPLTLPCRKDCPHCHSRPRTLKRGDVVGGTNVSLNVHNPPLTEVLRITGSRRHGRKPHGYGNCFHLPLPFRPTILRPRYIRSRFNGNELLPLGQPAPFDPGWSGRCAAPAFGF
jgi:hypothetical protein